MNQTAALRDLDAAIVASLADAGIADAATYVPPGGGAGAACTVLVDRAAQFFGETGDVAGYRITVALFLAEIASPARGGMVTLTETGEAFKLNELDARDESMARWVVVNG